MALFHLSVTQTKRSAGQSAIASAAYRAGERLYSEYYGEYSDYTRKGGVICSDIFLPSHAPPEYADRQTLWNAVEKAERGKNACLLYTSDAADEIQRLENRAVYYEKGDRRKRAHRLITRGAAIESVAPQTKDLSETAFYAFAEQVFALPDTQRLLTEAVSRHAGGD